MNRLRMTLGTLLVSGAALALLNCPSFAGLTPYDAPSVSCVSGGQSELTVKICAGASGAPAGVTIHWEEKSLFDQFGWLDSSDPRLCKLSLSGQPSLQHPGASRWELAANQCQSVLIGDINFDETGVSGQDCGLDPLKCGTEYVFRAFAHAGRGFGRSDWSADVVCSTDPCPSASCTFTQGYWKTHGPGDCVTGNNTNQWPLSGMTLGTVSYTDVQLCQIFNTPAGGNGLISLAHQLIAAKLNLASGASCSVVTSTIAAADLLIGSRVVPPVGSGSLAPSSTSTLTMDLDAFNNGVLAGCPLHCGSSLRIQLSGAGKTVNTPTPTTWGNMKAIYR
jgi:hypothetical protein